MTAIKSILIVDDNQTIRAAVRSFLQEQRGILVCGEAVDGFDALEKAHTLRPDLIVLDLSMPQMNGLETARILRANAVPVPIILFTMYAEELRPQDATEAGIDAVVAKEDLTVLHHQIEKLLVISPHRTLT